MELGNQDEIPSTHDADLSINNVSTSWSEMTINYKDISTDGVFDLKKIESWSLPSIQRRTAEPHRDVNMAKQWSSQFTVGRVTNLGNSSHQSLPGTSEDNTLGRSQPRYRDRSFTNSNLKKGVLEDIGFSADSDISEPINDRRKSKQKNERIN